MPGCAAGELALFEQDNVGEAELGQVVGDAGADDAAADDDDVGAIRKRCGGHVCVRRPLSVGGYYVVEQPRQAWALEFGDGGLVAFHRPGPEVEVQCAGCALDAPPQRPPVLCDDALQVGAGDLVPQPAGVVARDELPQLLGGKAALAPDVAELETRIGCARVLV